MSEERTKHEWRMVSYVAAMVRNVQVTSGKDAISAAELVPFAWDAEARAKGTRVTRDTISLLKAFVPERRRSARRTAAGGAK